MIKACALALMLPASLAMAAPEIGTVAIYSDGQVEKLIETGKGWELWEDQRKRLYKKSVLPFMPIQSLQKFPERSEGYNEELVFGRPEHLKPFGDADLVRFEVKRANGRFTVNRHWTCSYSGKGKYRLHKQKYKTHEYHCERAIYKKGTYFRLREAIDLAYSPTLEVVVDRRRTDSKGKSERIKLIRLLTPKKATAKRISRTVYKLRQNK